jgi:hypothetical protein
MKPQIDLILLCEQAILAAAQRNLERWKESALSSVAALVEMERDFVTAAFFRHAVAQRSLHMQQLEQMHDIMDSASLSRCFCRHPMLCCSVLTGICVLVLTIHADAVPLCILSRHQWPYTDGCRKLFRRQKVGRFAWLTISWETLDGVAEPAGGWTGLRAPMSAHDRGTWCAVRRRRHAARG